MGMGVEEITAWGAAITGVIAATTKLAQSIRGRRERKREQKRQEDLQKALEEAARCGKPHVDSLPVPAKEAVIRSLMTQADRITPLPKSKVRKKPPTK